MARRESVIDAAPEDVFAVLADPRSYAVWVVGSRHVSAADEDWPAAGSGFDHTVGMPPVTIDDETVVLESDPPRRLKLHAKARPLPSAIVTLELRPEGSGTRVVMVEDFAHPLVNLIAGPLGHGLIRLRNIESLRRLKALVEHPENRPADTLPHRMPHVGRVGAMDA